MVIGAGIGGLVAALRLAGEGVDVTLVERAARPGGKLREIVVGGEAIDAGPTVLTLRDVFEAVFADAGTRLDAHLTLTPASLLARHAWDDTARLDLFADVDRSADAIGSFAGAADARGYRAFCARARAIYDLLDAPFIRSDRPSLPHLMGSLGSLREGLAIAPFSTLWRTLGSFFADPRLRQLFGRYATYCGSSPYACPATLMLVRMSSRAACGSSKAACTGSRRCWPAWPRRAAPPSATASRRMPSAPGAEEWRASNCRPANGCPPTR